MVRVWYEPPPYGPGTDLNRTAYGFHGDTLFPKWRLLERASKMKYQSVALGVPVVVISFLCYIPLMNPKLPFTMEPEYVAASRAYMRYHNMNPIFGISSKKSRELEPDL